MWTSDGQTFYEGDCRAGDRAATAEELAPLALDKAKIAKIAGITAMFDGRIAAGLPYGDKVLQIREADRNIITAVFGRATAFINQAATSIPDVEITWPEGGYPWRMLDDSYVMLSPPEFIGMAQQVADYYGALFYVSRAFKDAVAAAETIEAVEAIDITAGWPGEE